MTSQDHNTSVKFPGLHRLFYKFDSPGIVKLRGIPKVYTKPYEEERVPWDYGSSETILITVERKTSCRSVKLQKCYSCCENGVATIQHITDKMSRTRVLELPKLGLTFTKVPKIPSRLVSKLSCSAYENNTLVDVRRRVVCIQSPHLIKYPANTGWSLSNKRFAFAP